MCTCAHARMVIIFASPDDPDAGFERARGLYDELTARKVESRFINKLGFDLADLYLVAQHKIVSTPTVVFFDDERSVSGRVRGLCSAAEIESFLTV